MGTKIYFLNEFLKHVNFYKIRFKFTIPHELTQLEFDNLTGKEKEQGERAQYKRVLVV